MIVIIIIKLLFIISIIIETIQIISDNNIYEMKGNEMKNF